jgi:hypothetical protein
MMNPRQLLETSALLSIGLNDDEAEYISRQANTYNVSVLDITAFHELIVALKGFHCQMRSSKSMRREFKDNAKLKKKAVL